MSKEFTVEDATKIFILASLICVAVFCYAILVRIATDIEAIHGIVSETQTIVEMGPRSPAKTGDVGHKP